MYKAQFKVFDDGVTYTIQEQGLGNPNTWAILHEGEVYDCVGLGYHLNPQCVEIIMRSLP